MIKYKEAWNKLAALQAKNEALSDPEGDIPAATEKRVIKAHGKPAKMSKRQKLLKNMGLAAYRIALFNTTAQNMTANVSISNINKNQKDSKYSINFLFFSSFFTLRLLSLSCLLLFSNSTWL